MSIKKTKYGGWVILALLVFFVAVPYCVFPSQREYRKLIQDASKIELQYLPAPNYSRHFSMATIAGSEKSSIDKLSTSLVFRGVWVPFTDVSGNVYRIRVTKKDGSCHDIVVLGANKIRDGSWNIDVSPKAVETIKQVVVESGGQLPDNDILMKLLAPHASSSNNLPP